jgi:hypothetical protein
MCGGRLIMCRTSPVHDADDYNENNGIVGDDARLLGCAKPPTCFTQADSSFINNSINPHTWGEKGAVPIAFHIRASMTTFVMVFSHIVIKFISYEEKFI